MRIKGKVLSILLALTMMLTYMPALAFAEDASAANTEKNSTYGFFVWLSENAATASEKEDAAIAAQIISGIVTDANKSKVFNQGNIFGGSHNISYDDLLASVELGGKDDATSLDNMRAAVAFISSGNACRAEESLPALKVSSALMAMAELNADYQDINSVFDHSCVFSVLENLAFIRLGGTWEYGEVGGLPDDPYEGWYVEEKVNYENNNGGLTGHYETLTDRQGAMLLTGFGLRDRYVKDQLPDDYGNTFDCLLQDRYYSQTFSSKSGMYNVGDGVTPEAYLAYIDKYKSEAETQTSDDQQDGQQGSDQNPDTQTPGGQQDGGQNTDTQTPGGQQGGSQDTDTQTPGGQQGGGQNTDTQTPGGQQDGGQNTDTQTPDGQQDGGQNTDTQTPGGQQDSDQNPDTQTPDGQQDSGQNPDVQTPSAEVTSGTPEVTLSETDFTYKFTVKTVKVGKKKKKQAVPTKWVPTVDTVTLNGKELDKADYDVTYSNAESSALGKYSVTVTLKGKYKGIGTATYNINPKPAKISKPTKGKKKMTVKWKKAAKNDITYKALDGYEIQYSMSPDFSSADTKTVYASRKAASKAIKKLRSKQPYYVRVRTYKNTSSGKVCSSWSAVKSVTVK